MVYSTSFFVKMNFWLLQLIVDALDEEGLLFPKTPEFPQSPLTEASSEAFTADQRKRPVPGPETRNTRRVNELISFK